MNYTIATGNRCIGHARAQCDDGERAEYDNHFGACVDTPTRRSEVQDWRNDTGPVLPPTVVDRSPTVIWRPILQGPKRGPTWPHGFMSTAARYSNPPNQIGPSGTVASRSTC